MSANCSNLHLVGNTGLQPFESVACGHYEPSGQLSFRYSNYSPAVFLHLVYSVHHQVLHYGGEAQGAPGYVVLQQVGLDSVYLGAEYR